MIEIVFPSLPVMLLSRAVTATSLPLGLAAKGSVWYLVADTDAGLRTFRVDRVISVERTGERAVRPPGFDLGEAWRLITAVFLHANLLHVAGNMFALGWCGPRMESAFGRGVTDEEIARWGRVVDCAGLIGAFDEDGALVGTAGSYGLTVTVPGGSVLAAGVTMVGWPLPAY